MHHLLCFAVHVWYVTAGLHTAHMAQPATHWNHCLLWLLQVFLTISILMGEGMYMVLRVLVSCECDHDLQHHHLQQLGDACTCRCNVQVWAGQDHIGAQDQHGADYCRPGLI
jgi:hypothetical protein